MDGYYSVPMVIRGDPVWNVEVGNHRIELLTHVIKSLLTIIPNERGFSISEEPPNYVAEPSHLLHSPPFLTDKIFLHAPPCITHHASHDYFTQLRNHRHRRRRHRLRCCLCPSQSRQIGPAAARTRPGCG